jgi:hypothetical protein
MRVLRRCCLLAAIVIAGAVAAARQAPPAPNGILYSTTVFPGAHADEASVDASGRTYFAGSICEATLPVTSGAAQSTLRGPCDGFIAVLGADKRLLMATYIGGSQRERIASIAVDSAGNIYVAGDTTSPDFPATAGAYDVTCGTTGNCASVVNGQETGRNDAFAAKFSPSGALVYATFLGGSDTDLGTSIAVDSAGRAHVGGYTRSTDFPVTAGAVDPSGGGSIYDDAFYVKLSPGGDALTYGTYISGSRGEHVSAIALDASGAAFVAGTTESWDLPAVSAAQPALSGERDGFIMKIAPTNALQFLTYFGGSALDTLNSVSVSGSFIYFGGATCSADIPGAPPRSGATCSASYVARMPGSGASIDRAATLEGSTISAVAADSVGRAYVAGNGNQFGTVPPFEPTPDAIQPSPAPGIFAVVPLGSDYTGDAQYATYFSGRDGFTRSIHLDGAGGAFIAGQNVGAEPSGFPIVNAPYSQANGSSWIVHFVPESRLRADVAGEIVMYAEDASAAVGNWRLEVDQSAAMGRRVTNPNLGAAKVTTPLSTPPDYVEFRFEAQAGVDYHLWIRGQALNDHWSNDSVWVQFSDSVSSSGAAQWRIGTASGTAVNLEDCANCGNRGWGWQDNGYGANVLGPPVRFAASGTHTLRIQPREDGFSLDQIVLSRARFASTPPGPVKQAATVLPRSSGQAAPAGRPQIVLHMTGARVNGTWAIASRADAASGVVVRNPDAGAPKVTSVPVPVTNYFELTFDADAGRAYRLWIRGVADRDYWGNDSVHVQFSESVNASGAPIYRIGTSAGAEVNLEDCSGCGIRGWGWQDNGWGVGVMGPLIHFARTGPQTIRVSVREDGFNIDQIVLSSGTYLNASPGALRNDTTILPAR